MTAAQTAGHGDSIGRFIAGDPLRALAATLVVTYHAFIAISSSQGYRAEAYGDVADRVIFGSAAVIFMFFALSGYLLGRPYVRAFVLDRPAPRLGDYARNRVARIVPAFWAAVTVTFIIRGVGDSSAAEVASVYALVSDWFPSEARNLVVHVWSVDAEAMFYVLLPAAMFLLAWLFRGRGDRRTRLLVILGLLAAAAVLSLLWRARHPLEVPWQRHMPAIAFAIAIGMALGALEIPGIAWARGLKRPALLGGVMFGAGWAVLFGLSGEGQPGSPERTLVSALGCALIMGGPLVRQWAGAGCSRLLDNRPMHAVGRWSYSIYLFHLVILYQAHSRVDGDSPWSEAAIVVPVSVLGAIALGALSFQLIEKPCMRFRGLSSQPTAVPHKEPTNLAVGEEARGEPIPAEPEPVPHRGRVDPPSPVRET